MNLPLVKHLSMLLVALAAAPAGADAQAEAPPDGTLRCPLTAPYRSDNAFARIIRGELPVSMIAQDEHVMAIVPLEWEHPGHALVITKAPARNIDDVSDRDALAVLHMVKRIAVAQQRALGSTGFSVQQNNGRRQDVCHFHVHVIPNTPAVAAKRATRVEMDAMAARLRAALPPG